MLNTFIIIFRLLLSSLLSGVIGFEREIHHRAAGLRTHILVCLGSTLVMLTSLYVFDIYKDKTPLDPVRIAAGVITGIGFLGAGTIIRMGQDVRGLTTAASLWVSAAIGLGVGCGFYIPSIFTTLLVIFVLFFLRRLETKFLKKDTTGEIPNPK